MEAKIIDSTCCNCKYYEQEYYEENGRIVRYVQGYCKRRYRRKTREQTCADFSLREIEREEELLFRRQQLLDEIEELTAFLSKLKALAHVAREIQELCGKKED